MKEAKHIKSAQTTTDVSKTRADIMTMLDRYGGTGFGYEQRGDSVVVSFTVPGAVGSPLRIAYPVNVTRVMERLAPINKANRKGAPTREQAERVAWRNIYEMVDAAFAAASLGATTIEEVFHAHILIETADGATGRLYDYVETLRSVQGGKLPGVQDVRKLLQSGQQESR